MHTSKKVIIILLIKIFLMTVMCISFNLFQVVYLFHFSTTVQEYGRVRVENSPLDA